MNYLPITHINGAFDLYHLKDIPLLFCNPNNGSIGFQYRGETLYVSLYTVRQFDAECQNMSDDEVIAKIIKKWDRVKSGVDRV